MSLNKIKISTNTRKVLNKTKEILGMQGENMKDVLLFVLSEKIEGTAVVEIELPNTTQSFIELIEVEDGYELPVKSVLTEQVGFVKFQLRILQNKVEVFKSEIFELEVKESTDIDDEVDGNFELNLISDEREVEESHVIEDIEDEDDDLIEADIDYDVEEIDDSLNFDFNGFEDEDNSDFEI